MAKFQDKRDRQLLILSLAIQAVAEELVVTAHMCPNPDLEDLRQRAITYVKFKVKFMPTAKVARLLAQIDAELG